MKFIKILLSLLFIIGFITGISYLYSKFITSNSSSTSGVAKTLRLDAESKEKPYISPISIDFLRSLEIEGSDIVIEEELPNGSNYKRYIASYVSDGYKIFGLLTIPTEDKPSGGFPAIVFNHGYIPPQQYVTTEKYVAYIDSLARNGFVVFKIDLRGNGESEGNPTGSYFSNAYTIDALSALKSLQKLPEVNPDRIGMWGHSMSGNLVLRAMLVSEEVKAGVIWGGAVYSYEDFRKFGISDNSYVRRPDAGRDENTDNSRETSPEVGKLRDMDSDVDFNNDFWKSVSLTANIKYLKNPIQLNHAKNDSVVNPGYSADLAEVLEANSKNYEYYEYGGGGHNIDSPYFEQAMDNTVKFFKKYL